MLVSTKRRDLFLKRVGTADTQCVLVTGCVIGLCRIGLATVSYTHLRAHETVLDLVCRLLLEKKKNIYHTILRRHI